MHRPQTLKYHLVCLGLIGLAALLVDTQLASDEDEHWTDEHHHEATNQHSRSSGQGTEQPKDRILLRELKELIFNRNKRTTSRRTHSIHQLSCVGGTAGCKLFTPDVVTCENSGLDPKDGKPKWRCHAEMSDRVRINHVEVICEGYDYAEDDYILAGSCGLEFTLDYTDPLDHHDHSYFKHMDEHEKQLHHDRVRAQIDLSKERLKANKGILQIIYVTIMSHLMLVFGFLVLALGSVILVRYLGSNQNDDRGSSKKCLNSSYGPLTSAVMTTKKAC